MITCFFSILYITLLYFLLKRSIYIFTLTILLTCSGVANVQLIMKLRYSSERCTLDWKAAGSNLVSEGPYVGLLHNYCTMCHLCLWKRHKNKAPSRIILPACKTKWFPFYIFTYHQLSACSWALKDKLFILNFCAKILDPQLV